MNIYFNIVEKQAAFQEAKIKGCYPHPILNFKNFPPILIQVPYKSGNNSERDPLWQYEPKWLLAFKHGQRPLLCHLFSLCVCWFLFYFFA